MRSLLFAVVACSAAALASCASDNSGQSAAASSGSAAHKSISFFLRNDSASTLTVQPFEPAGAGGTRQPFGPPITIAPGRVESRELGAPGKIVALTIQASGQDIKYQSGEWVLMPRAAGWRLYAFTDDSGTVRLNWDDRGGEVIQMQ